MPTDTLLCNIRQLFGIVDSTAPQLKRGREQSEFTSLDDAWIWIEKGRIADYGKMETIPERYLNRSRIVDVTDKMVLPAFADSHTHLVFAKSREEEFVLRIKGKTYEEIAAAGGGILNSSLALQSLSENELYESAYIRLHEVIKKGTGAIEIKSGYGLTVVDEIKMLRVIQRLKRDFPIPIKATFLGAHAIPIAFKNNRNGYIEQIITEMLPRIADEGLADFCDVFCDEGFFTPNETDLILKAAQAHGLKAKVHGNELGFTGGVQVAVANKAISVDHLEHTGSEEIASLLSSNTIPTALPNCSFFLGIPYAPVRTMIDAGLPVCLASDYNPGTAPSGSMPFVLALGCIRMQLTPEEAWNATTINGAAAMQLEYEVGSITKGKRANLIITKRVPSLAYLPYTFTEEWIDFVMINGEVYR